MALMDMVNKITGKEEDPELEEFDGEEYEDEDALEPDPAPARVLEAVGSTAKTAVKNVTKARVSAKLNKTQKQKIMDKFAFMMQMPGMMLSMYDPICGGAIANNAMPMAEAMIPIIQRNPEMLEWFLAEGGGFMDYVGVAMAAAPIVGTVYKHHVSKSIGHDHDQEEEDYGIYGIPENV